MAMPQNSNVHMETMEGVTVMLKCGYFNWKNQISIWTFFGGETKKLNP
jgi:hypothetical protein